MNKLDEGMLDEITVTGEGAEKSTSSDMTREDVEESFRAYGWKRGRPHEDPEQDGSNTWYSRDNNQHVSFDPPGAPAVDKYVATFGEVLSGASGVRMSYLDILLLLTGKQSLSETRTLREQASAPALSPALAKKLEEHTLALERGKGDVFSRAPQLQESTAVGGVHGQYDGDE